MRITLLLLALASVSLTSCKGSSGQAGAVGASGPSGPSGPQGARGEVGPQGEQGVAGAAGAAGAVGAAGAAGAAGSQGVAGAQGAAGPQGAAGAKGLAWRGAWSPLMTYVADDAVEYGGSAWMALATSSGSPPPGTDWQLLAARGDAGATGAQGPKGDVGAAGAAGAQGPQGEVGPQGFAGVQGPVGAMGPVGPQGASGPAGLSGSQGAPGPAGVAGPQGVKGLNWAGTWNYLVQYAQDDAVEVNGSSYVALVNPVLGAQPPTGQWALLAAAGAAGPPGVQGERGYAGLPGSQGPVGVAGPQGPEGPQGAPGQSVAVLQVPPDPSACPLGGARILSAAGEALVCNGSSGGSGSVIADCGAGQTNLASDSANCGGCGRRCDSGTCAAGACYRTVFLSSVQYSGALGGLVGADAKCQANASAAGLRGVYRAWLADSTHSAATRLTHAPVPYVLVSGLAIARSWTDLLSDSGLLVLFDLNELGQRISSHPPSTQTFWSGSDRWGAPVADRTCGDWTSTVGDGGLGGQSVDYVCDSSYCSWTYPGPYYRPKGTYTLAPSLQIYACNIPQSLLCIEQ